MKYNSSNVSPLFSAANKMFLLLIALLSPFGNGYAQNPTVNVFEDWNTTSGTQNNFQRTIVRSKGIGGATYYYLCGSTINSSGNYDFLIQKKNASGVVLWAQTYNGSGNGNDYATDVQVDNVGNVYICGTYYKNSTDSNNAILIKYNNAGTHQWTQVFNGAGSGHDALAAIQLTSDGILVAGTTWQNSTDMYDMLVMRYDTTGSLIWSQNWDYNDLNDIAVNLYSSRSRIYVAGGVQSAATTYKYGMFTVLYSDGSYQGSMTAGGTAFGFDQLTAIQYDDSGYVYLTGGVMNVTTGYDIKTIKLDTLLNTVWSVTYTSSGVYNDVGTGLALDTAGNIFVTGYKTSATSGKDYVTIKYSSGGTQRWVSTFDGGTNAQDSATAIVVRDTTQIYVTGYSYDSASVKNYYTIKYDGAGNEVWAIAFNSRRNGSDVATAIAVDSIGGVIVAGQSDLDDTTRVYTTVRYIEEDIITPPDTTQASKAFLFEENRGQLYNDDTLPETGIRFYCKSTWPCTYFSDTTISYIWSSIDTSAITNDSMHRVDMKLIGANDTRVYPMNKQEVYYNYLLGYLDFPLEAVPLYSQLIYPNVYSKIDIMYTSNSQGLKHSFIMKAGGNASNIEMDFVGADSVKVVNDTLMVYTILGVLKQRQATAFEIDNSGNRVPLAWQPNYSITGSGTVEFINIGSFTSGRTLVFECDWGPPPSPTVAINTLEWSSFVPSSGVSSDDGQGIAANSVNAVWITGYTRSAPFLGQIGATVAPYRGGQDGYVTRFGSSAQNQWVSYIGGSFTDHLMDIALDGNSNAYVVGYTNSNDFIDQSNNGIDYGYGGGPYDAVFVVLDPFGMILCDSHIGGNMWECASGVAVGKGTSAGTLDIYIVGYSISTSGFPFVSSGNFNQQTIAGSIDGFIMKLDQSYTNVWTSFFGGDAGDIFTDVALRDPGNNPVITGTSRTSTTLSPYSSNTCGVPATLGDFPFCDNGGAYYSQNAGGLSDAIIVEFDNSNQQLLWSTYFGGSDGEIGGTTFLGKAGPAIEIYNDNVYILGGVQDDSNNFPLLNSTNGGTYNQGYGNNTSTPNGFIARFDANRQQTWTSYIGADYTMVYDVTCDQSGIVYITGYTIPTVVTGSSNYCLVAPVNEQPICDFSGINYMETNLTGGYRTFILAFDQSDNVVWSTLFGMGASNKGIALDATTDKLFLTGDAAVNYTPVEYNATSTLDYYQPTDPNPNSFINSTISRFDISHILIVEPVERQSNGLLVYPNPAGQSVSLLLDQPINSQFTIQVVDLTGRIVMQQQADPMETTFNLDISNLANGMYFIEVITEDWTTSQKFIKNQ